MQTSLFFMTEKKLSVPLKVVVMLLCCRGLLRPFLQQNWHMQLLRVCKQLMKNNRLVFVRISQWVWLVYHRNVYARIGSFCDIQADLESQMVIISILFDKKRRYLST